LLSVEKGRAQSFEETQTARAWVCAAAAAAFVSHPRFFLQRLQKRMNQHIIQSKSIDQQFMHVSKPCLIQMMHSV
jgi:hypothetical protein